MKPTIRMIAEYAGVSRGTVDRVLHGRPRVDPEKRKLVEDALKKFNYTPNRAARALALRGQDVKIGMLWPYWPAYFERELNRGITAAKDNLRDDGLEVVFRQYAMDNPDECLAGINALVGEGVRALAVCSRNVPRLRNRLRELTAGGMPLVTFNSDVPRSGRLCFVGQDNFKGGRLAGDLLLKVMPPGGRVLVVSNYLEYDAIDERVRGFKQRLSESGVAAERILVIETHDQYDVTLKRVREELRRDSGIVGLYMANESTAAGASAVAKEGRDGAVRIVCHDTPEATLKLLRQGKVDFSVDQNMFHQGLTPIMLLADFLFGGRTPEKETAYEQMRIVCGENA